MTSKVRLMSVGRIHAPESTASAKQLHWIDMQHRVMLYML